MNFIFQSFIQGMRLSFFSVTLFLLTTSHANAKLSGEQVFNTYCIACHMSGVAGAPKFGNHADWQPRIDKGIDLLLTGAINGIKAMPPRGLCFDCNDDELKSAIEYIIDNSQD